MNKLNLHDVFKAKSAECEGDIAPLGILEGNIPPYTREQLDTFCKYAQPALAGFLNHINEISDMKVSAKLSDFNTEFWQGSTYHHEDNTSYSRGKHTDVQNVCASLYRVSVTFKDKEGDSNIGTSDLLIGYSHGASMILVPEASKSASKYYVRTEKGNGEIYEKAASLLIGNIAERQAHAKVRTVPKQDHAP